MPPVACVWAGVAREKPRGVLPDGCVDLVRAPGLQPVDRRFRCGRPNFGGTNRDRLGGDRSVPGVAAQFLGTPASLLTDRCVTSGIFWPRDAARSLQEQLDCARS